MKTWVTHTMLAGVFLAATVSTARADESTTARVGALQYIEGRAFIDDRVVQGNQDKLPILDEGDSLRTGKGHAEMLLTPGVFLRLDAQSEVKLVRASLTDTLVELNRGASIMEVDDLHKDNRIRLQVGSETVTVLKTGLYRFDAQPAKVEVLKGKVETTEGDRSLKAGKNHEVLSAGLQESKFKAIPDDDLSRWSRLRSEYEADASIASAQYMWDMGMPWGWGFYDWFWNPWFDAWTWMPLGGFWLNPYGFGYWSPWMVYNYYPIRYYGYRHYAFSPNLASSGRISPSGLNLQRGAALRAARSGMMPGGARGWSGGRMGMGRAMSAPAMGVGRMGGGFGRMGGGFGGRR